MGNDGTTINTDDRLRLGQHGRYSASASVEQYVEAEDIALGQVHMRQDIDVTEDERWASV